MEEEFLDKEELDRYFNIRRRIKDKKNIKDSFKYETIYESSWYSLYGELELADLSDQDKFVLLVMLYDLHDYGVTRASFNFFGWSKSYVSKLAKNEKYIYSSTLFNDEGLFAGKGYCIAWPIHQALNKKYKEFLWHDNIDEIYQIHGSKCLTFEVNIPGVFEGKTDGYVTLKNKVILKRPRYNVGNGNWPKEGYFLKEQIECELDVIKKWQIYG